ncbi:MAG: ParB/RepB/Spo0J family partition protein [Clostridia bacterium]
MLRNLDQTNAFTTEKVVNIELSRLKPFQNHPFKLRDDEMMKDTVESVSEYGVLVPVIARPLGDGDFELISGHRRHRACEIIGLKTMPVIVRKLTDEQATIFMVDSNLQRESILPSERAFAYKMKLDAIKKQGERTDLTSCQVGTKFRSDEIISENAQDSPRQIQRYIRLTELIPDFLDMVDTKKMGFTPAVELSYLTKDEQEILLDVIDSEQNIPSLSQAQRIKALSKDDFVNFEILSMIMREEKKTEVEKVSISSNKIKKYFPKSYSPEKIEEIILKLLESWHKKRTQNQER